MTGRRRTDTAVAVVGAGPAGLMLSHLLAREGIDSVVVDHRSRREIELTARAGILEADSVALLVDSGVSDRVLREGSVHEGIALRFGGASHRIDFRELVDATVTLYPQTDVFVDLADARERDGGDVRFDVADTEVVDVTGDRPGVLFTDAAGVECEVRARVVVGADGSRSTCRSLVPETLREQVVREYPYAWFGILCDAPPSAPELVYARSERGFALVSQRTASVQRLYFECDPDEDVDAWPDERIWAELQARVAGDDGFALREGPVTDKAVLRFRSSVCEPMRYGTLLLAGDAAHTVPPTGAKGLNLALADVRGLAEVVAAALGAGDLDILDRYAPRALERVWRAQHFSYWLTSLLHRTPGGSEFDARRQLAELRSVVASEAGRRYLAEGYTGRFAGL
ncbi:p-hydroxybenzoate 3-monooxygenase [Jatrophihabitans endophyticus]|uniref:p-hydroxybenzoate 3-monooxygenase n=1 Tax=Jatrophihabitans endophyticus TaxID=1206085 RepID=A0A1M5D7Z3_9ACTN|nr:4-hydroxybenzoate 3-monooxygenase [Jatrophihabitans endophyticus]SHF63061.1 p-hydroxybenzoate 3-monooxygenase [Jatrophihabitans endophyticus]